MSENNGPKHEEVRSAIEIVKAHLDVEYGPCSLDDNAFGCPSCMAAILKLQLDGVEAWLDAEPVSEAQEP